MNHYFNLGGRLLMGGLFLVAGLNKIGAYAGTQGYMEAMGVSGMLLPLVILLEVAGGAALIVGWHTRLNSLLLAGFTLLAAVIFHADFTDQMQMILFMKNVAIAGGLLILAGQTLNDSISLDRRREALSHGV